MAQGSRHPTLLCQVISLLMLALIPRAETAQGVVVGDAISLPAAAQGPRLAGTAVLRGRVSAADTGRPLARARITAVPLEPGIGNRSVLTGNDGRYEIGQLPAGRYTITAARSGYLTLKSGQRRPLEPARPIQIADAVIVERLDFTLPRASVLAGRVTDETGEAIADARVFIMRARFVEGQRQLVAVETATTDDRGDYRTTVDPGVYFVMATLKQTWAIVEGGEEQTIGFAPTYFPGTTNSANAQRITLGVGGGTQGIDFSMVRGRAATISGTATDSQGRPLQGETVYYGEDQRTGDGGPSYAGGGAIIAADGRFTIKNVAPGNYKLVIRYVTGATGATGGPAAGAHVHEVLSEQIVVDGRDIRDLRLTTSRGWSFRGRVVDESGRLPAVESNRIKVLGIPTGADADLKVGGFDESGVVKEDGSFEVAGVFGSVRVRATLPTGWTVKAVLRDGRDVTDVPFELSAGDERSAIEVVVTNRLTTLSGHLVNAGGGTAADGTVLVFADREEQRREESRYIRAVRPDQNGEFEIRGLPPGDYLAVAFDYLNEGAWNDPEYLGSIRRYAERIRLTDGGSQTITLRVGP